MLHPAQTPHRYEARAFDDTVYEITGTSFEGAALEFADRFHQSAVELTDCETGERRCFILDVA